MTKNIQNKVHRKKKRNKRDKNNNASHKKRIQNNNKNRFARFVRFTSMEFSQMETRTRKRVELGGADGAGPGESERAGADLTALGCLLCWSWTPIHICESCVAIKKYS